MKKHLLSLTTSLLLISLAYSAYAVEREIGVKARFRQALSLSNVTNIDYGTIEYAAEAANNISISAANGSITCSNSADYICPTTGSAGSATIGGSSGVPVLISCSSTGILSDGAGHSLNISNVQVRMNGANGTCAGLGTSALTQSLASSGNVISVGATLVIPSTGVPADGQYDTANSSGVPIKVRVIYQ